MRSSRSSRPAFLQRCLSAAALLALLAAPAARAAHPMVTDDTGTQGAGRGQLELTGEMGRARVQAEGQPVHQSSGEVAVTFSYGLSEALDVVVSAPTAFSRMEASGTLQEEAVGTGDLTLELKWRLLEAGAFGLAVKPGLTLPTGDVSRGLGTGRVSAGAVLVASQDLGALQVHLNAGYGHREFALAEDRLASRPDVWHASLAATGEVLPGLQLVGNLGVEASGVRGDDTLPAFALAGLVYSVGEHFDVDVGIKADLNDPGNGLVGLAGLAARF
jgi:hypothetical protein